MAGPGHSVTHPSSITNNSGITQSYARFAGEPVISPVFRPIRNDIITVFTGVPGGGGGQAYFTIPREQLYAICGTSYRDDIENGAQLDCRQDLITPGDMTDEGRLVAGVKCGVSVEGGSYVFSRDASVAPLGNPGYFCIRIGPDLSFREAKIGMS
ncbi:hypothetical protein SCARD494_04289 [Seiridium cardinale]